METESEFHILASKVRKHLTTLYLSKTPVQQFFELIIKNIQHEFDLEFQDEFGRCTFDHRLARRYPLSSKYRLAFVKRLMEEVEKQSQEVHESVYEEYTSLMSTSSSSSQFGRKFDESSSNDDYYFVTRLIQDKYVVTKQSDAIVSEGTTGLRFWEGGLQLFEQVFANRSLFKNKKILELGSGNGFTGIAISKFCELAGYIFTDHHYRVFQLLKENLALNGFHSSDLICTDRRLNKFYETEDEEGNRSIKYYERDDGKEEKLYEHIEQSTSYFLDKGSRTSDKTCADAENEKEDLIQQSFQFDQKIQNLNDKMSSFEDFLESFKEKLTIIDEKWNTVVDMPSKSKWDLGSSFGKSSCDNDDMKASLFENYDETNVNLNKNVVVCELDWTWDDEIIKDKFEEYSPDFLIGADIVFDPDLIPELVRIMRIALNVRPTLQILLICSIRNSETIELFDEHLNRMQNNLDLEITRTRLAARFSIFKHLPCSQPFYLCNIQNAKDKNNFC